jgi:hypothetical protein
MPMRSPHRIGRPRRAEGTAFPFAKNRPPRFPCLCASALKGKNPGAQEFSLGDVEVRHRSRRGSHRVQSVFLSARKGHCHRRCRRNGKPGRAGDTRAPDPRRGAGIDQRVRDWCWASCELVGRWWSSAWPPACAMNVRQSLRSPTIGPWRSRLSALARPPSGCGKWNSGVKVAAPWPNSPAHSRVW